jgi:hypothetical protein
VSPFTAGRRRGPASASATSTFACACRLYGPASQQVQALHLISTRPCCPCAAGRRRGPASASARSTCVCLCRLYGPASQQVQALHQPRARANRTSHNRAGCPGGMHRSHFMRTSHEHVCMLVQAVWPCIPAGPGTASHQYQAVLPMRRRKTSRSSIRTSEMYGQIVVCVCRHSRCMAEHAMRITAAAGTLHLVSTRPCCPCAAGRRRGPASAPARCTGKLWCACAGCNSRCMAEHAMRITAAAGTLHLVSTRPCCP